MLRERGGVLPLDEADLVQHGVRPEAHVPAVAHVAHQRTVDRAERRREREPDPELPVGEDAELLVESSDVPDESRSSQHARCSTGHDVVRQERARHRAQVRRVMLVGDPQSAIEGDVTRAAPRASSGDRGELRRELGRRPDVIVVEERHPRLGRSFQALVAHARHAERPLVAHHGQTRALRRAEDVRRPVARTVVDDDRLDLHARLADRTANGALHEVPTVVGGDHDRDALGSRPRLTARG